MKSHHQALGLLYHPLFLGSEARPTLSELMTFAFFYLLRAFNYPNPSYVVGVIVALGLWNVVISSFED